MCSLTDIFGGWVGGYFLQGKYISLCHMSCQPNFQLFFITFIYLDFVPLKIGGKKSLEKDKTSKVMSWLLTQSGIREYKIFAVSHRATRMAL